MFKISNFRREKGGQDPHLVWFPCALLVANVEHVLVGSNRTCTVPITRVGAHVQADGWEVGERVVGADRIADNPGVRFPHPVMVAGIGAIAVPHPGILRCRNVGIDVVEGYDVVCLDMSLNKLMI